MRWRCSLQWSDGLVPVGDTAAFRGGLVGSVPRRHECIGAGKDPVVSLVNWPTLPRPPSVPQRGPSGWRPGSTSWINGCATRYAVASQVWIRAGYGHFDTMAARMVDAQAPGIAGMLRSIPAEFASVGWPSRVLEQLGALHLLIQAHRRLDDLP